MGTLLFWLLRVAWVATLLPWAFFAFGTIITYSDDNFILWYPVAMLFFIVPAEVLRAFGHGKTAWIVGATPLLLVALLLKLLMSGPYDGFIGVPSEGPYAENYGNGQIMVEGTWVRHAATSSSHNHTDQKQSRAHAANHGHRTTWHPNSQKASEGEFIDGEETGAWTTWYPNGQMSSQGNYVSINANLGKPGSSTGEKVGAWTTWYASGNKASEEFYKHDPDGPDSVERDGTWTTWHANGERQTETVFVGESNQVERETTWRIDGQKWDETLYQGGQSQLKTYWYDNGQKQSEIRYVDGRYELETIWTESGKLREKTHYIEGSKTSHTTWFENGQMSLEETFARSRRVGLKTMWHENGQKKFQIHFGAGELAGPLVEWDEDGNKIFEAPVDSQAATDSAGSPSCYFRRKDWDVWGPEPYTRSRSLAKELEAAVVGYSRKDHREKYRCFLLDACNGGLGRYENNHCAKWAESEEAEAIPWVEE